MKRSRRISISAAVTTGLVAAATAAVAGVPGLSFASASSEGTAQAGEDNGAQERQQLQAALDALRTDTSGLEDDLAKAKHELRLAQQAAAARAAAARAAAALRAHAVSAGAQGHHKTSAGHSGASDDGTPGTPPETHGTTGASGSGGGEDDGGDDGHDDGGHDGGGGGDD
jgi:hypothetical protein